MYSTNNGWVKLHLKLSEKAYYSKDSEKVHLWLHLLFKAFHKPREEMLGHSPIWVESGKFTTGRKQLSLETGICESKIERILTYFEKIEQQIEQQKTSVNRLISITNWSDYQATEQHFEQQMNNDRTTSEQQVNTLLEKNKNKKEYKKEEKIFSNDVLELFDYFKSLRPEIKPNENTWKEAFDKLIRIDKKEIYEIKLLCERVSLDTFWRNNFLSPSKLRDKDKNGVNYYDKFKIQFILNYQNNIKTPNKWEEQTAASRYKEDADPTLKYKLDNERFLNGLQ